LKTASTQKAKRRDQIARWIITLGGVVVIVSVVAILALIVGVTIPLFESPRVVSLCSGMLPAPDERETAGPAAGKSGSSNRLAALPLGLGVEMDLHGEKVTALVWLPSGVAVWKDLRTGKVVGQQRVPAPKAAEKSRLCRIEPLGGGRYSLSWSNGVAALVEAAEDRPAGKTADARGCSLQLLASMTGTETASDSEVSPSKSPTKKADALPANCRQASIRRSGTGAVTWAGRLADGTIAVVRQCTVEVMGEEQVKIHRSILEGDAASSISTMTMDHEGSTLYAGTNEGRLIRWQLDDEGEVSRREVVKAFPDKRAITALGLVLGDVSLAVGDAKAGLTVWSPVNADGTRKLVAIHRLRSHDTPVCEILASGRNKSILSLSEGGVVHVDHMTSERELVALAPKEPLCQVAFGARGDAILGLDATGMLTAWHVSGGCPEVSLKTLFGKVHYEGYDSPQYVWQTTGGEEFEAKFSLVPLVFGTLKGTLYAMLFAIPMALSAAMYVSYFTTPGFRRTIKPLVEIMASVPSVVIGFLIALWLAPIIERWLLALFLCFLSLPATFAVFMGLWQWLRQHDWARRVENGYEFLAVLPILLIGAGIAIVVAVPLETWLFGGHFSRWLFAGPLHVRYDPRNSIIIAFGLGFTVIPIIFSIAEDSLSNVPYSMAAASMAVGASRWQTLWRVVLPSASPGIFAAMMIGFGRAVGETMIVLMATGNTPILDWSIFNGMRTLSANIAVEIPEAPVDGTLYRVLFLCAVLLFLLTFTVNTAAELVRQRLRKRFGRY
jgi:phosphate transport system permease protein